MEPEWARHQETINIQKIQTEILKKQTFFTEILALGTIIMAFSSFFELFNFKLVSYNTNGFTLGLSLFAILIFFICIVTLIYKTYEYLIMKK